MRGFFQQTKVIQKNNKLTFNLIKNNILHRYAIWHHVPEQSTSNTMDLKTLNRIDTLRRLKSRGPKTPSWPKPYHILLFLFLVIVAISIAIRVLQPNY